MIENMVDISTQFVIKHATLFHHLYPVLSLVHGDKLDHAFANLGNKLFHGLFVVNQVVNIDNGGTLQR